MNSAVLIVIILKTGIFSRTRKAEKLISITVINSAVNATFDRNVTGSEELTENV
jgi:hypothetical protein